jgi:hypothetical protein
MGTGTVKNYTIGCFVNTINKEPVGLDMTFGFAFIIAVQEMIVILRGKCFLLNRGCSKTSVFGTATLNLGEKPGFQPVFPRACSKTNRVLEQAQQ